MGYGNLNSNMEVSVSFKNLNLYVCFDRIILVILLQQNIICFSMFMTINPQIKHTVSREEYQTINYND